MTSRHIWAALTGLLIPMTAFGQTYNLSEAAKPGENFRITLETGLSGTMKVSQDGKETAIKLAAKNDHVILERVLQAENGLIRKTARFYETAACTAQIGDENIRRGLRDDRRFVVAQRLGDELLCYSPAGPMTRTELEAVSEHFDTLYINAILPGKEVAIEDSWKISNAATQALCLLDGLISHDLRGKLTEVKNGNAIIVIEGKVVGIELGASVKLDIKATAKYDLLNHRLIAMEWRQKDSREQGPASPAIEIESTTNVKRTLLDDEPKELSKGALSAVPQEDEPQGLLKQLIHADSGKRYSLLYSRDWHVVGQTDNHLVLRLLDRGDFIAQATIANWKKADAGKHLSPEEFTKMVTNSPGWECEDIIESGEVPTDDGRWMYRVTAKGELEGTKVIESFIMLAGPGGDQVVVTFTMKPANATKIGTRDVALVNSIEFPDKK